MSRVFINAKTEMICGTISAALEDAGAEITCCFDDEEAAAKAWKIRSCRDMLVHYLEELQLDLDRKEALEQGETP